MTGALAMLIAVSAVVSFVATGAMARVGRSARAFDGEGVQGQVKAGSRRVPNIGGIGLTAGLVLPLALAGGLALSNAIPESLISDDLRDGLAGEWLSGLVAMLGLLAVHVLGVIDDRRPLSWRPKLLFMLLVPVVVAWLTGTRVLSAADAYVGGSWLSIGLTAIWFAAVMNAVNFMDNMDGLAAGVAGVIAACIAGVAFTQGQWLVAGASCVLLGATIGFLPHNYPRARIFMGDGGSLVLGYCLAFLTTRLTYLDSSADEPRWDRLLIPLVLLAVPLYDMLSVIVIRLSQGRSPFVGDLQHLSHRFEGRGLARPHVAAAVWALALIAGLGGIVIAEGTPRQSVFVAVQTLAALALLALLERSIPRGEA